MPPKIQPVTLSDRLELAKSISNLSTKTDAFINAVDSFKSFSKDVMTKLDLDMETKKVELSEITQEISNQMKNSKIEIELNLKEFKRDSAIKILKEFGERSISTKEYDGLVQELHDLRQNLQDTIDKVRREESEKSGKAINAAQKNMDLTSKAQNATLAAESAMKDKEIKSLRETIADLRQEIGLQRELTKQVSMASSQHYQPTYQAQSRP